MAKAFSVASWNVEHFKGKPNRVNRVVDFLRSQQPDAFALYEVEGATVFSALTGKMPGYTFHITEGPQFQEILVGVRGNLTGFFTQKEEFKAGVTMLRPGALLTVTVAGKHYSILFLHTKSLTDPRGMGLRDDMLDRACKFRKVLNKAAGGPANYLFLGDLNTMGMYYPYNKSIEAEFELRRLRSRAARRDMRMLTKDEPATFWNGPGSSYPPSDLDHVIAAEHLRFRQYNGADVTVKGWPKLSTDNQKGNWINRYSDHGLLYFEVQRV